MVKMIENYQLQENIGEGQYGIVYKARDTKNNVDVAIKVVQIQKFKDNPKLEECTINEIKMLSMLQKAESNQHIVKFIELLKTANNYYFVYNFCNGGTLEKYLLSQRFFPEQRALNIFQQLLKAFKSLTQYNIMHRDLKPTNILLHDGVIKLADFGFCTSLKNKDDMAKTMLGSPIYMAPEILRGQEYSIKADIWSLGVVLYEMLFGFCPFEERTIAKLIKLQENTQLEMCRNINNISIETENLLNKMLIKDPKNRIDWSELFMYELDEQGFLKKNLPEQNLHSKSDKQMKIIQQNVKEYNNGILNRTLSKELDDQKSDENKIQCPLDNKKNYGRGNQRSNTINQENYIQNIQKQNVFSDTLKELNDKQRANYIEIQQNTLPIPNILQNLDIKQNPLQKQNYQTSDIISQLSQKYQQNKISEDEALDKIIYQRNKLYFLIRVLNQTIQNNLNQITPFIGYLQFKIINQQQLLIKKVFIDDQMKLSIAFPEIYEEIKDVWEDLKVSFKYKKLQILIENEINQFNQFYVSMKDEFEKYLTQDQIQVDYNEKLYQETTVKYTNQIYGQSNYNSRVMIHLIMLLETTNYAQLQKIQQEKQDFQMFLNNLLKMSISELQDYYNEQIQKIMQQV